jgi:ABC-2 type transport system permease protein
VTRAISERFPTGLSWGLGLGLFGLVIAASGAAFIEQIGESPEFERVLSQIFPGIDMGTVGGFLELLFIEFGLVMAGLAAAGLVGGWAADERTGRLEMLLPTPVRRSGWPLSGAAAVFVAIAVLVTVAALGVGVGTLLAGGEVWTPVAGTVAVGLYAAAMAGIGIAIGGVFGPAFAAPAVLAITLLTWLVDLVGGDLGIPDALHQLALSTHMGQPMVGVWDPVGIVACLGLAIAGTAIGTLAFARRDLKG